MECVSNAITIGFEKSTEEAAHLRLVPMAIRSDMLGKCSIGCSMGLVLIDLKFMNFFFMVVMMIYWVVFILAQKATRMDYEGLHKMSYHLMETIGVADREVVVRWWQKDDGVIVVERGL
ncbi:hypothetical protein Fot_23426 [Forsythia ovata]|uniref:Uncharacterized protein n=1 Tax=Forsythia ovata TaxID=205694 RepID=A0ABD1V2E8_9LAMI